MLMFVKAAEQLLDNHGPADWDAHIDTARLNIASHRHCVLGQLYGSYMKGLAALPLGITSASAFAGNSGMTRLWRTVVARRQIARGIMPSHLIMVS